MHKPANDNCPEWGRLQRTMRETEKLIQEREQKDLINQLIIAGRPHHA